MTVRSLSLWLFMAGGLVLEKLLVGEVPATMLRSCQCGLPEVESQDACARHARDCNPDHGRFINTDQAR